MVDELGPDINEKMRALCRKISVAHDLDAEIQEELRGHLEDKLLGYLSGKEAVSEDDAFILVREHFGDPSSLKGLLQDVHAFEAQVSIFRRLLAAIIVTSGVNLAYLYFRVDLFHLWPTLHRVDVYRVLMVMSAPVSILVPWLLLRHWQRRLDEGHRPWFLTWRPDYLVGAVVVLIPPQWLVSMRGVFTHLEWEVHSGPWMLVLPFMVATPVLQCFVWLWWCDRPPRKARAVGNAAGIWALWMWFLSAALMLKHSGYSLLRSIAVDLLANFGAMVLYAALACILYAIARRAAAGPKLGRAKE